jgi:hypothetical protein
MQQLGGAVQSILSKQLQHIINLHAEAPQGSKRGPLHSMLVPCDDVASKSVHACELQAAGTAAHVLAIAGTLQDTQEGLTIQPLLLLLVADLLCVSAAVVAA